MTSATNDARVQTVTAPANATLSGGTRYWLLPLGSQSCSTANQNFSVLRGWGAGARLFWDTSNSLWRVLSGNRIAFATMGAVHAGDPQEQEQEEAEEAGTSVKQESLPVCTEERRNWRQCGRELPHACRGGFYHSFNMYPSSDPCDQPRQVPGSNRRDCGCLNRY